MSAAQSLRQVVAPWQWLHNETSRLARWLRAVFWVLLLLLTAGMCAAAWIWAPPRVAAVMVALVVSAEVSMLWGWQFAALLRLDHPHSARLVPGHAARSRVTALALWAAGSAITGAAATALLAWGWSTADWAAPSNTLPALVPAAGAALLYVALALRWPLLWLLAFLAPVSPSLPGAVLEAVKPFWQPQPWLACAVLLVAMALALVSLFGRGDAAHAEVWERRERWRRITRAGMVGQKPTLAAYGRWGEWLGAPWQRLADGWLERATQRAHPTPASVMTRAEIVLHGAQHWVRQFGVLVPLLLVLVALFTGLALYVIPGGAARLFESGHVGMGIGLISMVLGTVVSLPGSLWISRREQALLMLLPGMPRGAALNRALAWRQARHFLMLWALTLPAFVGMAWFGQVPQVLAMPAVVLPAMAWMWRNAARQGEPSASAAVLPFLSCLVLGIGTIVLLRERPEALLPVLGAFVGVTAVLLVWRWWQLSRWPQALPAGRLA